MLGLIARLGVSIYSAYGTDLMSCANVSANQSFKLSNLEWYRVTKFIARLILTLLYSKMYVNMFYLLDNPRNFRKDGFERGK